MAGNRWTEADVPDRPDRVAPVTGAGPGPETALVIACRAIGRADRARTALGARGRDRHGLRGRPAFVRTGAASYDAAVRIRPRAGSGRLMGIVYGR